MQEILLTEDEAKLLQNNQSNKILPRMLLIFDNYDENHEKFMKASSTNSSLWLETSFMKDCKSTRVLIASRTEFLSRINPKGLFFGAFEQENRTLLPHSFSEISLRPLSDTQIQ